MDVSSLGLKLSQSQAAQGDEISGTPPVDWYACNLMGKA
jgi:hypothetical protein